MVEEVPPEQMRVSDVDRKAAADRLNRAHDDGMITLSEFDSRVGAAWQAATRGELARLTADLPDSQHPIPQPAPPPPRPPVRRRTPTALRVLNTIWLSILAVSLVVWGLICITTGHFVYPWWLWVITPGAVLGVVRWTVLNMDDPPPALPKG
ncbi:MAG TPA: DUF1707 domain-containing protein [Pseudonocardiaceae bacterium]|nr:DUF1707 domain-containing protein [Pseudonocardiaceae bacterium]